MAKALKAGIPSITKLVTITEDNDPNNLIGRPNGYTAAVVVYDKRVKCTELGVDCGASVEQWRTADDAKQRARYIAKVQKGAPVLGSEYHYLLGRVLVRVTGELKPSEANDYKLVISRLERIYAP